MKNKKGLTLVELLGVIVVLAILSLITIPIISNVIINVRIKSLENSAYGLIEASNLYYAQNGSNNIRFDINDNKVSSSDTDVLLSYKGSVKKGTIILDKKGRVTVCITDGKNSAYKNYNESRVTIKNNQTCYINDNSNIVYLSEDGATRTELSIQELTDKVVELQNKIDSLASNLETVSTIANNAATKTELDDIANGVDDVTFTFTKTNSALKSYGSSIKRYGNLVSFELLFRFSTAQSSAVNNLGTFNFPEGYTRVSNPACVVSGGSTSSDSAIPNLDVALNCAIGGSNDLRIYTTGKNYMYLKVMGIIKLTH